MKNTGIVRRIDPLGRIVLPSEIRERLNLVPGSPIEIYMDGADKIVLKKYQTACAICGENEDDMVDFCGKHICKRCVEKIKLLMEEVSDE